MVKKLLKFIQSNDLNVWVFFTGGIILVIEVVALRLLSPYFGNTLYSVSSVLSVVLLALSIGYWVGGLLADKRPERALFYTLILASGLLLLALEVMRTLILTKISEWFSLVSGPLIASAVLFIGPSFLLGMLSPLAIKLKTQESKKLGIGRVSGGIFFWSTLGSISGSLLAGFVLIPHFGSSTIMLSLGILLVCMGLAPLLLKKLLSPRKIVAVLGISLLSFAIASPTHGISDPEIIYRTDGVYERITVKKGFYAGRPTHFLEQDRSFSGAAFTESDELVYQYTKYYELYKLFRNESLDSALVLGGGAYSIPKALLKAPGNPVVDVAEIEPHLYGLSKQYFGIKDDPRLRNYVQDGRSFLRDTTTSYDLIFGDVYHSLLSIPTHFTTVEFFNLAKSKLSEDGVFISNVIGDTFRQNDSFTLSEIRTFQAAFPNSYFIAVDSPKMQGVQNIIMVGIKDEKNTVDIHNYHGEGGIFAGLADKQLKPERFNIDQHILLTDDYAPVDFLIAKTLNRSDDYLPTHGQNALALIEQLVSYGPRYSGSPGNRRTQQFLRAELELYSNDVSTQIWEEGGQQYGNIVAKIRPELPRRMILSTHYDSRRYADRDPVNPTADFLGANDSASGVAVLLEVARKVQEDGEKWPFQFGIDFIFFDGEEGNPNDDNPWRPIGSEYFA